jgi:outer membrane murein-binding lipoprotein Lpp
MLIKICLAVAIAAGLFAAGLSFVKVKEKITTIMAERDKNAKDRDDERAQKQAAQKEAKTNKEGWDKTKEELTTTKDSLEKETAKAIAQEKRANTLAEELTKTKQERDDAQGDLAAWKALGIPVNQIKTLIANLKETQDKLEALTAEKKIVERELTRVKNELAKYIDPEYKVPLPPNLKGKIVVVDPKYDFVVLDVGEKQGVLEDGELLVNRSGRLVAKLRIRSVQPDRSIANVLPGWKLGDVMEGDQVFP